MTKLFLLLLSFVAIGAEADTLRRELQLRAIDYFLQNSHPKTGLVRDRARNFSNTPDVFPYTISSIAATGFGLAVLADAAEKRMLSKSTSYEISLRALKMVASLDHFHGWLYHFTHWETGKRQGTSEISTIDTAIFLAGALHSARVFPKSELAVLAKRLFKRVDFDWMMTNGNASPTKRLLSMGWVPESGYLKAEWDSYSEHLLLLFLGFAHPGRPLPSEVWHAWKRPVSIVGGESLLGAALPLFAHQYPQLFIDFRTRSSMGHFFQNSRHATLWNRRFCSSQSQKSKTYEKGMWGLSASDSKEGYQAFSPTYHDGTVCPSCAGASAHYSAEVLEDLRLWKRFPQIYGKYGFSDAVNLESDWIGEDVIGITVGALYLSLSEAFHSPSTEIRFGLKRAASLEALRN